MVCHSLEEIGDLGKKIYDTKSMFGSLELYMSDRYFSGNGANSDLPLYGVIQSVKTCDDNPRCFMTLDFFTCDGMWRRGS